MFAQLANYLGFTLVFAWLSCQTQTMANNRYIQRPKVAPPHVPLGALRVVSGKTLESVVTSMNRLDPDRNRPWTTGALSAVETGHRGASPEMLVLLARVYGLNPDLFDTAYSPRSRAIAS